MAQDPSPVHVPLRTSSRNNLLRSEAMESQEKAAFADRRTSKAQRILGTDLPMHNNSAQWDKPQKQPKSRRASLRTPDSSSRQQQQQQNTGFVAFPTAKSGDMMVPPQNLRVRASSPLLGHEYLSHDPTPPLPKPSKKIHQSGSSSTLFSYFRSQESKSKPESPKGLQPRIQNELGLDPHVTYKQSRTSPKESKRKLRPPRIDLSILFPKPRNPAPPLLSPQRMTNSPSPVSTVVSDYPSTQVRPEQVSSKSNNSASRRFGDPLPLRTSVAHHEAPKQHVDRSDLLSIPESSRDGEWLEQPLERTVGTSEIDLALDRYAGRRSLFSRSSVYTGSREQLQTDQQRRPSDTSTATTRRGQSPARNQARDRAEYLSPRSKQDPHPQTSNPSTQTWRQKDRSNSQGAKTALTKKSSKSTLKNKDLQNTSVLCLSSSDDETEEELETPVTGPRTRKPFRDSVETYGEYEGEVYTAQAAQAATAHMLRKVDRAPSTSSHGSHPNQRSKPTRKHAQQPSMSSTGKASTGKSSTNTRGTSQSRRSSGIPTIAEPNILEQLPQPPTRTPRELKEMNRRSRVIAVTRQEQDLLEAMRLRKGKVTPSMFNYAAEPDRNSVLSVPSRDSFCGSDTSFLRLSAAFPPFPTRSDQGASHMDKDGSPSQSGSDNEQKTSRSIASTSYAESLPSPSTNGASPLTPTLPIHRFSPLPSPKPHPRGPPPAIPEDQKQHTRRRTDSSEAIMLNGGEPQPKHDLPLWSFDFDWNHDRSSVAAVH
ncbi:hypothetical protein N7466_004535 [Penicillium verhagenii]|uniref:uncharacterized protein n=1 Tax=Penicillium verhagenii TaxID=1562060 RepID=UPI0025451202|nr:uncharacterized protein N7466_004535 [Penicillium verhagenii]KAJ5934988.1 hypothetical protein N7466_004535 [Penicillium verhagenii]